MSVFESSSVCSVPTSVSFVLLEWTRSELWTRSSARSTHGPSRVAHRSHLPDRDAPGISRRPGRYWRYEDDVREPADVRKEDVPECAPQIVVIVVSSRVECCCGVDEEVVVYKTYGFVGEQERFEVPKDGVLARR